MKPTAIVYQSIRIIFILSLLYNAFFMLWAGEPGRLGWWPLSLAFYAWAGLPFLVILGFSRLRKEHVPSLVILLIHILLLSGGGFYLLWQAFFVCLDPQVGIVFVMLPLYQLGGAVIGILAALVIGAIFKKKSNTSS